MCSDPASNDLYLCLERQNKQGARAPAAHQDSSEKYDELERFITENHSYEVPEIVAIDAERVSGPYLEWMKSLLA